MNNPDWLKPTKKKLLGKHSPWLWAVEPVHGCNLSCWHCTARLYPSDGVPKFMSKEVWKSLLEVCAAETPHVRLEMGQAGEPTLHPDILEFASMSREISPTTQIQTFTNGINLLNGKFTYKELFDAGFHSVYVDMYAPRETHIELAKQSGFEWFLYNDHKVGSKDHHHEANTYYGDPKMNLIILQDRPENRKGWRKVGRLSTFLNYVDWEACIPKGLLPVREPYKRRCTMPWRYASVNYKGDYTFCCIDFLGEACGQMGSVLEGPEGFRKFWFGRLMQSIRRRLLAGDRAGIPYCSRCNCAFSKCDCRFWPEETFDSWWDGSSWRDMPSLEEDAEVFADGWEKKALVDASLPTEAEEDELLKKSNWSTINSIEASRRRKKRKGFFD